MMTFTPREQGRRDTRGFVSLVEAGVEIGKQEPDPPGVGERWERAGQGVAVQAIASGYLSGTVSSIDGGRPGR
jgi:hypothetical protein